MLLETVSEANIKCVIGSDILPADAEEHGELPGTTNTKMWKRVVFAKPAIRDILKRVSVSYVLGKVLTGLVWRKTWLQEDGPALRKYMQRRREFPPFRDRMVVS